VAVALEVEAQQVAQLRLVLDHQDAGAHAAHPTRAPIQTM
jgi:hypothetical protein